jgi:hypothetical protein
MITSRAARKGPLIDFTFLSPHLVEAIPARPANRRAHRNRFTELDLQLITPGVVKLGCQQIHR